MDLLQNIDSFLDGLLVFAANLLVGLIVIAIARVLAGVLRRLLRRVLSRWIPNRYMANFVIAAAYYGTILLGIVYAFSVLGGPAESLTVIVLVIIFVLGISLQETLGNLAATLSFIVFEPFLPGEWIEFGGVEGKVEEIQLLNTVVRTQDNKLALIGNQDLLNGTVLNYIRNGILRADVGFNIGFEEDLDQVRKIIIEILDKDQRVLTEPAPSITADALADSAVQISVEPWVNESDYWDVRDDLKERAKLTLEAEGIRFPYPKQEVQLTK